MIRANRADTVADYRLIADSLAAADQYRTWDAWSLGHSWIVLQMELLAEGRVNRLLELGAGYSTIALANFATRAVPDARLDTVEHHPEYAANLAERLAPYGNVRLHVPQLRQLKTASQADVLSADSPFETFLAHSEPIPDDALMMHLPDMHYDLDPAEFGDESIDLFVVDGPNGTGRVMSFALYQRCLKVPGYVLIDDYLHQPFLHRLAQWFEFEVLYRLDDVKDHGTVLVRTTARR